MILRSGFKAESFISAIACTIARNENAHIDAEDVTFEACQEKGNLIYLAGGYWRAVPSWDAFQNLIGVRLVNPDRSVQEIVTVERGIAILCHYDYRP